MSFIAIVSCAPLLPKRTYGRKSSPVESRSALSRRLSPTGFRLVPSLKNRSKMRTARRRTGITQKYIITYFPFDVLTSAQFSVFSPLKLPWGNFPTKQQRIFLNISTLFRNPLATVNQSESKLLCLDAQFSTIPHATRPGRSTVFRLLSPLACNFV